MIRHDDNMEDLIISWGAMIFYLLGGIFLLITFADPKMWPIPTICIPIGGVFHFLKVSTDGRVRK